MKSPTTLTARAEGAQTANAVPVHALVLADVRTEPLVQLLVPALADQVQIQLAERRQERVRILDVNVAGVAVVDLELVAQRQLRARRSSPSKTPAGWICAQRDRLALRRLGGDLSAAGRSARITTPPLTGCAPSSACGSECSRLRQRVEL